jgi:hypothetical protein
MFMKISEYFFLNFNYIMPTVFVVGGKNINFFFFLVKSKNIYIDSHFLEQK